MSESRLPVALDVAGRLVVVVGGGAVAERKALNLLANGADLTVIAPELTAALAKRAQAGTLRWVARAYQTGDLAGAWLAFAATDAPTVNQQVAADAAVSHIWCNVAAPPAAGSFHVLAAVRRDGVTVALGTEGASPFAARKLREGIESVVTPEVARLVGLLGEFRAEVQARLADESQRRACWEAMWQSEASTHLRNGDEHSARELLASILDEAAKAS